MRLRALRPVLVFGLAIAAGCSSAPSPKDAAPSPFAASGSVAPPEDPEAARAEAARTKAERRRVVDATLVWIVAETEARAEAPSPEPEDADSR